MHVLFKPVNGSPERLTNSLYERNVSNTFIVINQWQMKRRAKMKQDAWGGLRRWQ